MPALERAMHPLSRAPGGCARVTVDERLEDPDISTQPEHFYTEEEYLAIERASDTRREYLDGVVYATGGASPRHVQVVGNIAGELRARLRDRPCLVYATDLRVRV